MKKNFTFILTLLAASVSFNSFAEMTITDESGGEVIFDKSQSVPQNEHFIQQPSPSQNSNQNNVVQIDNGSNSDLSPAEINAIQSQGG